MAVDAVASEDFAILLVAHAVRIAALTRVMAMRTVRRIQKFIEIVGCSPESAFCAEASIYSGLDAASEPRYMESAEDRESALALPGVSAGEAARGNHADSAQPCHYRLRPVRYRKLGGPQTNGVPAVRIQMHLDRNAGILQRNVVHERVIDTVHIVILGLHQKCGWRISGNPNIRVQRKLFCVNPQMPG